MFFDSNTYAKIFGHMNFLFFHSLMQLKWRVSAFIFFLLFYFYLVIKRRIQIHLFSILHCLFRYGPIKDVWEDRKYDSWKTERDKNKCQKRTYFLNGLCTFSTCPIYFLLLLRYVMELVCDQELDNHISSCTFERLPQFTAAIRNCITDKEVFQRTAFLLPKADLGSVFPLKTLWWKFNHISQTIRMKYFHFKSQSSILNFKL